VIALWAVWLVLQQAEPAPSAPRVLDAHAVRVQILKRDPRALPRDPSGKWSDYDPRKLLPEQMPPRMQRVRELLLASELVPALAELYAVLAESPDFPPALHQMGLIYFRLQRYGDSALLLERYLELAPARVADTRMLGHDYYSLGDYERAERHYERVLEAAPGDVEARRGLALANMRLGRARRALELLKQVLEREPTHAEAWTWKAQIEFDEDLLAEALSSARRARDLDPFAPKPWFLIAGILGAAPADADASAEALAAEERFRVLAKLAEERRGIEQRLVFEPESRALLQALLEIHRRAGDSQRVAELERRLAAREQR
jgi:tetratricopeptide (TPR) repeat protein